MFVVMPAHLRQGIADQQNVYKRCVKQTWHLLEVTKAGYCVVIFVPMDEPRAGTNLAQVGDQISIFRVSKLGEKVLQKPANVTGGHHP
ncbi:hypothetical protein TRAPUB_7102 [Trametes pubescens]|uniref:Uncharacterized protein n=1 Tax=Trametes pubescens TaxID=154538 RepID=A0A1M2V468_TRAPU|nr:hypothetical protein TRAPUB_7102 [Trametes pubescens]